MKALLQRVAEARVEIEGRVVGAIGPGLLVFICVEEGDGTAEADRLAGKVARLRIFEDDAGKMNRSVVEVGGAALVVSQFTLAADTSRGNRPSFSGAARPEAALPLYERFLAALRGHGLRVETGEFARPMAVALVNDGPVTIWIDSRAA